MVMIKMNFLCWNFSLIYGFRIKITLVFFRVDFIRIALIWFPSCCGFNPAWFVNLELAPLGLFGRKCVEFVLRNVSNGGRGAVGFGEDLSLCLTSVFSLEDTQPGPVFNAGFGHDNDRQLGWWILPTSSQHLWWISWWKNDQLLGFTTLCVEHPINQKMLASVSFLKWNLGIINP